MRITEISTLTDSDFSERARQISIRGLLGHRDWKRLGEANGVVYKWRADGYSHDVLIVKDRVAIGYALLQHSSMAGIEGLFMTEVGLSRWEHEGQGYGKGLYDILLDRGETLLSGRTQTRSGRKMWERLIKRPDVEVRIATSDGVSELGDADPWADPESVLIATRR